MGIFRFFVCLFLLHLSSASFASEIDLETGLVAHYKFDGDFTDSSGTGNHGAQQGGVTFVEGVDGQAAYFDGNDDYIIVPHSDSLALNRSLTLSIRIKPSYQQNEDCNECPVTVFTKDEHLPNNFSLWTEVGLQRIYFQQYGEGILNEDNRTEKVPVSFSSVNFHEIVVVKEISMVSVYFDGNKITEKNLDYDAVQQSGPLYIGYDGGWGYGKYKGVIDDLKIYNRALTEIEVMQLVSPDDIDLDGLPNDYETVNGLNPVDASDAQSDSDMDGLTALEEFTFGTSPTNDDTDRDTLPDGWEIDNGRNPLIEDFQLSSGVHHTCTLIESSVMCWGFMQFGQDNIPDLVNPTQISAGGFHNCVIDDSGVVCWGYNMQGQISVPELSNPRKIALGGYHSCALDDSGVVCWGQSVYGKINVPTLINPKEIFAGDQHTCAVDDTGLVCWGDNSYGQLDVPELVNLTELSLGENHSCAIDASDVNCWGSNESGKINFPELSNPIEISSGYKHTCGLDDSGVVCWGDNEYGQLDVPELNNPRRLSSGSSHTCALDNSGVICWGGDDVEKTDTPELEIDLDGDQYSGNSDAFPFDSSEWLDTDLDGIGNNADGDDDGDGIDDQKEILLAMDPLTPNYDIDNDGITNDIDTDTDNDGVVNEIDFFPFDSSEQLDHDSDGIGDNADADDDNDNVMDVLDLFPLNAFESADSDGDGVGDNADFFPNSAEYSMDTDLDQMPDVWERKYGLNPSDASDAAMDQDNDGMTALEEYEAGTIPLKILDIDANGSVDALTDGLIILRYIFRLRGDALVNNALAADAMRTDVADIEAYVDSLMPGL